MAVGLTTGILAAAPAITKFFGGLFGKKAAKSAAQVQQEAASKAAAEAKQVVADTNPQVIEAARRAGQNVTDVSETAATSATDTAERAAQGVDQATTSANALLNPYATAGATAADVLNKGIAPGGDFNRMPTQQDILIDPGFDFRYGNAVKDFESFAGAHGGVDNGGALRDFETFRQGTKSQEFQAAYDRFTKSTQNRFSNVFGVAGMGKDASTTQGNNLTSSARYGGDARINASQYGGGLRVGASQYAGDKDTGAVNLTTGRTIGATEQANEFNLQGANANASGKVAGSNAMWNGINGAVDAGTEAYYLNKNPNMFAPNRWSPQPIATPPRRTVPQFAY